MSKSPFLLALLLAPIATLTACTAGDGTQLSLAAIGASPVSVVGSHDTSSLSSSPTPGVDVMFLGPVPADPQSGDCPLLADDFVATFDGVAMEIASRGGYDDTGWDDVGCAPFDLQLANATPHPGAESTIVLRDASATWTIAGKDLLTDDLALMTGVAPGSTTTIAWPSAPSIDTAYVQLASGTGGNDVQGPTATTRGNTITFPIASAVPGAATLSVDVTRTAEPTRCDGPSNCMLFVMAGADFSVVVP